MREMSPATGGLIFIAGFVVLFAYLLGDGGQLMEMGDRLFDRVDEILTDALMAAAHVIAWLSGVK